MASARIFNPKDNSVIIRGKKKGLILSAAEAAEVLADLQVMFDMVCLDKDPSDYGKDSK